MWTQVLRNFPDRDAFQIMSYWQCLIDEQRIVRRRSFVVVIFSTKPAYCLFITQRKKLTTLLAELLVRTTALRHLRAALSFCLDTFHEAQGFRL